MAASRKRAGQARANSVAHQDRKTRKAPKVTGEALHNAALHYLQRFAASSEQLRRVLMRRVKRAAMIDGAEPKGAAALVDQAVARCLAAGLLDDRAFAQAQAGSLLRRGNSRYRIRQRLAAKGVPRDFVEDALSALDAEKGSSDFAAACALARRRRLGPYRAPGTAKEFRHKDLASLARAGFSHDIAQRVLAAADSETLGRLLEEDKA